MATTGEAYDLGTVAGTAGRPVARPVPAASHAYGRSRIPHSELLSFLPGSLSLFLPGSGQVLHGDTTRGLFFFCSIGFLGTLSWALLTTADRLAETLALLEVSMMPVFAVVALAYCLAGVAHVGGVLSAAPRVSRSDWHPAVSGLASALVPGWGQLLNGDRIRAGLFLACLWLAAAVWILDSRATMELLNAYLPGVGIWEQTVRQPFVLWTARWTFPAVLWSLAIYDAASSAASASSRR